MHYFFLILFYFLMKSTYSYVTFQGIVPLDDMSFTKVLCHHPVCLVIFHHKYAYGSKEKQYEKIAQLAINNKDVLVTELGTSDWGVTENHSTRKKYNISLQDYPTVLLLSKGNIEQPLKFHGEFTAENIVSWVKMESGILIGNEPCLHHVKEGAKHFLEAVLEEKSDKTILDSIIDQTYKLNENVNIAEHWLGSIYIKIMKKIQSKGVGYVSSERSRVKGLFKDGNLSEEKKVNFRSKLDVLKFFVNILESHERKYTA